MNQRTKSLKKEVDGYLMIYGIHISIVFILCIIMYQIIPSRFFPEGFNLLKFDALHYIDIHDNLYSDRDGKLNAAFFPGYPLFWKLLYLDSLGISILNAILGFIAFFLLTKDLLLSHVERMILLAIPSLFFLMVPYSESLFLIILTGYGWSVKNKEYLWMFIFLLLASFTRSAINIMLPALIFSEFILNKENRDLKRLIYSISGLVAGLVFVLIVQYYELGEWFVYLKSQSYWGHTFQIPKLPFVTWDGIFLPPTLFGQVIGLDAFALVVGLIALNLTFYFFIKRLQAKKREIRFLQLFGLISISGFSLFAIFFKGGYLFSTNRYILPTAMFFWMLSYTKSLVLTKKQLIWFLVGICVLIVSFFRIAKILDAVYYLLFPVILTFVLLDHNTIKLKLVSLKIVQVAIYGILVIAQSWYLLRFLSGSWVA